MSTANLFDPQRFLQQHQLPSDYLIAINNYFIDLARQLNRQFECAKRPLIVGINGCQGSGKSTLAALLVELLTDQHKRHAISLSIDDFYLTRDARQQLAQAQHPLLATRGVPGTHDTTLMLDSLQELTAASGEVAVPRFDKTQDDRLPPSEWSRIQAPLDLIILEGWCLGAQPQTEQQLQNPVNALESSEDSDGRWRQFSNQQLSGAYQQINAQVDFWVMLAAPSFDCVNAWRLEQEEKLPPGPQVMTRSAIARFIQHYQRITEQLLVDLPAQVDVLYALDEKRSITRQVIRSG